jgi:hypothetical protein
MATDSWGADVPVSLPATPNHKPVVSMGGFAFGPYGLVPEITEDQRERIATPTFVPGRRA